MAEDILVRRVPAHVHSWIENERQQRRMTKQEFVLSVLETAVDGNRQLRLPMSGTQNVDNVSAIPFTFVDLFAGIGGFRIPLEKFGGRCLFSSEKDRYSQKTYRAWFGDTPQDDITKIKPSEIPNHDLLAAGFPCQPFSIAGVSKKKSLGHPHGFKCLSQGTLFFNLATIIENKRPPVALLENVKNLKSHDNGRTWQVIKGTLADLEYVVFDTVLDAAHWVPQHRERIYIVCFDKRVFGDRVPFKFPELPLGKKPCLKEILEKNANKKYTLTDHLWQYLQEYAARHQARATVSASDWLTLMESHVR